MENVNDLLKNMDQISYGDKQRLFFSIQKLKQDQVSLFLFHPSVFFNFTKNFLFLSSSF